ncbi:MAG: hypothetical protein Q9187_001137 [Circinaria calcarea]
MPSRSGQIELSVLVANNKIPRPLRLRIASPDFGPILSTGAARIPERSQGGKVALFKSDYSENPLKFRRLSADCSHNGWMEPATLNRAMTTYLLKTRTTGIDLVLGIGELKAVRLSKARPVRSDFSGFTGSQL